MINFTLFSGFRNLLFRKLENIFPFLKYFYVYRYNSDSCDSVLLNKTVLDKHDYYLKLNLK